MCEPYNYDLSTHEGDMLDDFNCSKLPINNIKYVIGPHVVFKYNIGERTIILFGEHHRSHSRSILNDDMTKSNSILFSGFIKSLVEEKRHDLFDIMFESMFFNNVGDVGYSESIAIDILVMDFFKCIFESYREECNYPNARFHYIDYRNKPRMQTAISKITTLITRYNQYRDASLLKRIENKLLYILDSDRIQKQFNNIQDKRVRDSLLAFFEENIKSGILNLDMSILLESDEGIASVFMRITGLILDMYALPRILRSFSIGKENKQFKGTSKYVIYYTGSNHTNLLVEFFQRIGIQPTYISENDGTLKSYVNVKDLF